MISISILHFLALGLAFVAGLHVSLLYSDHVFKIKSELGQYLLTAFLIGYCLFVFVYSLYQECK